MWRPRSDLLFVGVSDTEVAWMHGSQARQLATLAKSPARFDEVSTKLLAMLDPSRLRAVHVVAGSGLARHWLQTPPAGLRSLAELKALTQSRADQMFGADSAWVLAADWHATRPFLCAAVPGDFARWSSAVAESCRAGAHLSSSLSEALARLAARMPADGWACIFEPGAMHFLHLASGRPTYVRTVIMQPGLKPGDLEEQATTELARSAALAGGLATEPAVRFLLGGAPHEGQAEFAMNLSARAYQGMLA